VNCKGGFNAKEEIAKVYRRPMSRRSRACERHNRSTPTLSSLLRYISFFTLQGFLRLMLHSTFVAPRTHMLSCHLVHYDPKITYVTLSVVILLWARLVVSTMRASCCDGDMRDMTHMSLKLMTKATLSLVISLHCRVTYVALRHNFQTIDLNSF